MGEDGAAEGGVRPGTVQLFYTCLVNEFRPEVAQAVVEVLESRGIRVEVPAGLTCCGQPAYNAGCWDDARKVTLYTLRLLDATEGPIVIPSGSCADMLVHQAPQLLAEDSAQSELARRVAGRCYEFSQFLVDVLGEGGSVAEPASAAPRARVAYHPSCHLSRGLGVRRQPEALLRALPVELHEPADADECCGFGGMFAAKQPEISGAMLDAKLRALEASGADTVTACDLGCLLHLGGGLHRRGSRLRVCHLAELMRECASP